MKTASLTETQLEERDGATWVTGNCAMCGALLAIAADEDGAYPPRRCTDCGVVVKVEFDRLKGRGGQMECSQVMKSQVECAGRSESIQEIARRMRDKNIGFLPVCGANGAVIGTITDRDIAIRAVSAGRDPAHTPVEEIMTPEVVACRPEDDLSLAEQRMESGKKSRIVIVDERGRPAGVISLSDIALVEPPAEAVRVLASVASREARI